MRARDRASVLTLIREAHDVHRRRLKGELRNIRAETDERIFGPMLAMPDSVYFVAETGRAVVGFVHCEIRRSAGTPTLRRRVYAYVHTLAVTADFRRQGIGRMLLDLVREWALGQEVSEIELNVFEFNEAALALYESLGYRTLSRRMRYEL